MITPSNPEPDALIAALASTRPETLDRQSIAIRLGRLADPVRLLTRCRENGLAPLVYHNLKTLGLLAHLPETQQNRFKRAYYRTLSDNLKLFEALREIAAACEIPLIVLKGPALISLIYRNPGLRPLTDLDLLLHPGHVSGLKEKLARMGYTPVPLYPDLYRRETTVLDLHTDPINRSRIETRGSAIRIDPDGLWRRAVPLPGFAPLRMLGPEDQIVTLSVHALKHGYRRAIWLVDIAESLGDLRAEETWRNLRERVRTTRTTHTFRYTLFAIRNRLHRRFPRAETWAPPRLSRFEQRLFDVASGPDLPQILELAVLVRSIAGVGGKIRYVLEAAFPRPEILAQISGLQNPWIFWLSYPLRLAWLVCAAFRGIYQFILHPPPGAARETPNTFPQERTR